MDTRRFPSTFLFAALTLSSGLVSQGRSALPLPRVPSTKPAELPGQLKQGSEGQVAPPGRVVPHRDDRPDFGPMRVGSAEESDVNRELVLASNPYVLAFEDRVYTPKPGVDAEFAAAVTAQGAAYGFIMIRGRMTEAKLDRLRGLGIELLGRHTWQSVKAKVPAAALPALGRLEFVHWAGRPQPTQQIASMLQAALGKAVATQEFDVTVSLFASDLCAKSEFVTVGEPSAKTRRAPRAAQAQVKVAIPNGPAHAALRALGLKFVSYDDRIRAIRGRATKAQILAMPSLDSVLSVNLTPQYGGFDDQAMAMVSQDRVRTALPGTRVSVGVIDSGVASPFHQDLNGKFFIGLSVVPGLGVYADGHGHGTHVLGTVVGRGLSDSRYMGAAPAVGNSGLGDRVFIGRLLNNSNGAQGDPSVLYTFMASNYTDSQRNVSPRPAIINNSWGAIQSGGFRGTGPGARAVDAQVHATQQAFVFAAGNKMNVPNMWLATPGDAKNAITVGSVRDDFFSTAVWPGKPSSFSRYGTRDGRRKPEVSAPGEIVTSLGIASTTQYVGRSGTSMATPIVTGTLASLIDRSTWYHDEPALCKAVLCAAAKVGSNNLHFNQIQGFGTVNSYKQNFTGRTGFSTIKGRLASPATRSGFFDIAIPSDATEIKVVLCYTEDQASANAAQAVTDRLRLWADAPPYCGRSCSGDWSIANPSQNVIYGLAPRPGGTPSWAGKTVRFHIEALALRSRKHVDYGVVVLWHKNSGRASSDVDLVNTVNKSLVKPNEELLLTAKLQSKAGEDEFSHGHIFFDAPTGWANTRLLRVTADSIFQTYTGNSHPSMPYPQLGTGINKGMTVGQGSLRSLFLTMRAPAQSGVYSLYTRAQVNGTVNTILSNPANVCVDGLAPNPILGLQSTRSIKTWYSSPLMTFSWRAATDQGCAGVEEVRMSGSNSGPKDPNKSSAVLPGTATNFPTGFVGSGDNFYFGIRAYDKLDNAGPVAFLGPFWIDQVKPTIRSVTPSAPVVTDPKVTVSITAQDQHSGVSAFQYSNDGGATWSPRLRFATKVEVDLTLYGGGTSDGQRTVRVRVVDRAGNVSDDHRFTVNWLRPPVIRTATPTGFEAVHHTFLTIRGSGFQETVHVLFRGSAITSRWNSAHEGWWPTGAFRIVSDSELRFYPPPGLAPGQGTFQVYNGLSRSNGVQLEVRPNVKALVRTSSVLRAGASQTIMVSKGGLAPTVAQAIILASVFNTPSVIPGVFQFDIGNNFAQLTQFPRLPFDANGVASITFPTAASFLGVTAYFQVGYLDPTPNIVWPMPKSDVWRTTYR